MLPLNGLRQILVLSSNASLVPGGAESQVGPSWPDLAALRLFLALPPGSHDDLPSRVFPRHSRLARLATYGVKQLLYTSSTTYIQPPPPHAARAGEWARLGCEAPQRGRVGKHWHGTWTRSLVTTPAPLSRSPSTCGLHRQTPNSQRRCPWAS